MKARSIKTLLIILRDNGELLDDGGLCWIVIQLTDRRVISLEENYKINRYIKIECEKECKEHWYIGNLVGPFYFPKGEWPPRLEWLNRHIDKKSTKIKEDGNRN